MPLVVPLQPLPSQAVNVTLGGQACLIEVAQKTTGMFINLSVNNALIIGGVICQNANVIVRAAYLGFIGDLAFQDTQGSAALSGPTDPVYTGLGSRYLLLYYTPSELPAGLS